MRMEWKFCGDERGWKSRWTGIEMKSAETGGDGCNFCSHAGLSLKPGTHYPCSWPVFTGSVDRALVACHPASNVFLNSYVHRPRPYTATACERISYRFPIQLMYVNSYYFNKKLRYREEHSASVLLSWCTL